ILTNRYLQGIPTDSRAARPEGTLREENVSTAVIDKVRQLNEIAKDRGQSMAQMALMWVMRDARVTSALIGASRVAQIEENVAALKQAEFTPEELQRIEEILAG
ncbi:MAG TPA: L-glyceraldehyde 3-phosphate reductase, partial [Candidatus Handelsmanbacteria bacterium]|nr:L-glyceraldehyde 3-phosphate reductase [Candidatus Handelsmanbacteria bacterium]